MRPIEFICPNFGVLKVIGNRLNDGHDFVALSNATISHFDYLIFLDSRGISREFNSSLANKLVSKITEMGKTYVLVCRPLELTFWATLIGFLKVNQLSPLKIITNMGFVDFTPKKLSILQDAIQQVEVSLGEGIAKSNFIENFSSTSEWIPLYSMEYEVAYRVAIEDMAAKHQLMIINTPLTSTHISIERKRPPSFFSAQIKSNVFNRSILGAQVLDIQDFDENLTYDAVHYTSLGNEVVFDSIKNFI